MNKKLTIQETKRKMYRVLKEAVDLLTYNPKSLCKGKYFTSTGKACLVGHFLSPGDRAKVKEHGNINDNVEDIFEYLNTTKIKELPFKFWRDAIQELNDDWDQVGYWNIYGLTEIGRIRVAEIKKAIRTYNSKVNMHHFTSHLE